MSDKYEISTRSGWKGELRVIEVEGGYEVKVALRILPSVMSRFFLVDKFTLKDDATSYARGIKSALERKP